MEDDNNIFDLDREFEYIGPIDRQIINAEIQKAKRYNDQKKAFQKCLLNNLTEANLEIPTRTLNDLNKKGFSKKEIEIKIIEEDKSIFEIYQNIIDSKV